MTTQGSFQIQWRDGDSNGQGDFYGRATSTDPWKSLNNFELMSGVTYNLYLSVSGTNYTTYVKVYESDGPQIGVKLPPTATAANPFLVGPMTLGGQSLQLRAAQLYGEDPKIQVGWGSGTGNVTVSMNWTGSTWTVSGPGSLLSLGNNVWSVSSLSSLNVQVTDSSRTPQDAVVAQLPTIDASQGTIVGESDLAATGSQTFVLARPTGQSTGIYSVNLYRLMDAPNQLRVISR